LHQQLKGHPNFWMPPQKEVDYLAPFPGSRRKYAERLPTVRERLKGNKNAESILEWWKLFTSDWSLDKYPQLFEPAGQKFCGDVSPNYSTISAAEIARAAEIVPQAKIVILLRDPAERAWSHARYTVTRGPKNGLPEAERIAEMVKFATSKRCLGNGDYVTIVRNWQAAFGAAQVHIAYYDDLVSRPADMVNGILAFLGASPMPEERTEALREVANKGRSYLCPPELCQELNAHYAPMVEELRTLVMSGDEPPWINA
jgi:hypothetical protein